MPGLLVFPLAHTFLDEIPSSLRLPSCSSVAVGATTHPDGRRTVTLALPAPSGRWVVADIDLALFLTAAECFIAVHGDPRSGAGHAGGSTSGRECTGSRGDMTRTGYPEGGLS